MFVIFKCFQKNYKARESIFFMIEGKGNYTELRKKILKADKPVVFWSLDDDLNRKVLEKEKIDVLLIKLGGRKDFMKQRNSGFNHVLAKIAKKKGIIIGIDFDEIVEASNQSLILARVQQNIKLCNKNKLKMKFVCQKHKRNLHDLKSLGLVLGMPTWMTSNLREK